jgi:hypothetical protein
MASLKISALIYWAVQSHNHAGNHTLAKADDWSFCQNLLVYARFGIISTKGIGPKESFSDIMSTIRHYAETDIRLKYHADRRV